MANEELARHMEALNEEVRNAKEENERRAHQEIVNQMRRESEQAWKEKNDKLAKLNNKPYENQLKFKEDQEKSKTKSMKILEQRGGLINNPHKPKPVPEKELVNLWDKTSHNAKYNSSAQKSKVIKGSLTRK